MATPESNILKRVQVKLSGEGYRLFRNNRGGFLTLDGQRKIRAGIEQNGSSDLIGFKQVTITPEMVGQTIAIFAAVEVKTETGRASAEQIAFLKNIIRAGGIGLLTKGENIDSLPLFNTATEN